jgi:hypothetical protein
MDALRAAIGQELLGDETLCALLSSPTEVHEDKAPTNTAYPYAIFRLQSPERPEYAMGLSVTSEESLWLVKGVCRGVDSEEAEDIKTRAIEVLHDTSLEVAGKRLLLCMWDGGMPPYSEDDSGATIYHRGALFRVTVAP